MITSPPRSSTPPSGTSPGASRRAESTPYVDLTRAEWSALRDKTPLPLTADEVERLRGLGDVIDLDEVRDIYLPLSRLLNLYVGASANLRGALNTFLGEKGAQRGTPFVIGVAGSVAVGKSTVARLLQALLARWPEHPRVELVTTDGFLLPMKELKARGLMSRKGFPESYDVRRLLRFLADVKAGRPEVEAPVYSHVLYDIVPGEVQSVDRPDIVVVEGLNVLSTSVAAEVVVSDFFDFTVYVDADEADIEAWYVERFLGLCATVFREPSSYFHRFADLGPDEAVATARGLWSTINAVNLRENILPTRERAHLILEKGPDHRVRKVRLRTS